MRMVRIAVAGASGYAGGELLRLLLAHPEAEIGVLTAGRSAGTHLREHQPHLVPLADRVLAETDAGDPRRATTSSSSRCRTAHSAAFAAALGDDVVVVDCGADHRLTDPAAWTRCYGGDARGRLAVRPARAARRPRRAARRAPGGRPRLLPDGREPGARTPRSRRGWPSPRSSSRRSAARPGRASRSSRTCSAPR